MHQLIFEWKQDRLERISKKYHYWEEDMVLLKQLLLEVIRCCISGGAAFWCQKSNLMEDMAVYGDSLDKRVNAICNTACAEVVITLGKDVDQLQEKYLQADMLSESYMVQNIGSELLLEGYQMVNQWIKDHYQLQVTRYHFFGSESLPLMEEKKVLQRTGQSLVSCNLVGCLIPKMSTVFLAELTAEENVPCQGICVGCNLQNCLNRPLSYGIERIYDKKVSFYRKMKKKC